MKILRETLPPIELIWARASAISSSSWRSSRRRFKVLYHPDRVGRLLPRRASADIR